MTKNVIKMAKAKKGTVDYSLEKAIDFMEVESLKNIKEVDEAIKRGEWGSNSFKELKSWCRDKIVELTFEFAAKDGIKRKWSPMTIKTRIPKYYAYKLIHLYSKNHGTHYYTTAAALGLTTQLWLVRTKSNVRLKKKNVALVKENRELKKNIETLRELLNKAVLDRNKAIDQVKEEKSMYKKLLDKHNEISSDRLRLKRALDLCQKALTQIKTLSISWSNFVTSHGDPRI